MHDRYSKLFSSIVTSSIWVADHHTFKVWIAMLAMQDSDGYVAGALPGFANLCGITLEQMQEAEAVLLGPDPYSRTPDHEGRRIERVPGGWRVLNAAKYDAMIDLAERREQNKERQQRFRDRHCRNANVTPRNANVTPRNAEITRSNAPEPEPENTSLETTTSSEGETTLSLETTSVSRRSRKKRECDPLASSGESLDQAPKAKQVVEADSLAPPPWWDGGDSLAARIAACIAATRLAGGRPAFRDPPNEGRCEKLATFVAGFDPGEGAVEAEFEAWRDWHLTKRKSPYTDPVAALRNWFSRKEPQWRQVKRERSIDARRSGTQSTPSGERIVARIDGRDMTLAEYQAYSAERGWAPSAVTS